MRRKNRKLVAPTFFLMGCLLFTIFVGDVYAAASSKIRIVVFLRSTLGLAIDVMQEQGFDKKHNIQLERLDVLSPRAIYTLSNDPNKSDITLGGWQSFAKFRYAGTPLVDIFPVARSYTHIVVQKDSNVQSIKDLRGLKIGVYGGPAGTTTTLFRIIAKKFYGIDVTKENKIHYGSPAVVAAMLEKGELDAIVMLDPITSKLRAKGYGMVGSLPYLWYAHTGQMLLSTCVATNDKFIKKDPDAVRNFVKAWIDTIRYINSHPEVWTKFAKKMKMSDPKAISLMTESLHDSYILRWDEDYINILKDYGKEAIGLLGQKYKILDSAFSTAFVPRGY